MPCSVHGVENLKVRTCCYDLLCSSPQNGLWVSIDYGVLLSQQNESTRIFRMALIPTGTGLSKRRYSSASLKLIIKNSSVIIGCDVFEDIASR